MSRAIASLVALVLIPAGASAQVQLPPGGVVGGVVGGIVPAGQAPARDTAPPKTGTSRIRGRVVAVESGQPVRRAVVRLTSPDFREAKSTSTDTDGRYEFRELPAGRYSLTASKSGFLLQSYGARRPEEAGRPLDLADQQLAERVDFSLLRGGVITGRVVDEFGEPVVGANVQPMRVTIVNGQRREFGAGQPSTTPDTGEFRIWGLAPGEYLVMVNPQRGGFMDSSSDDRTGYPATYYPGTSNATEAQPIQIVAAQTASGVDIILSPTRTAIISGTTLDSKGQPLRRGNVMLNPRSPNGAFFGMTMGGPIKPDGTFSISNVPPGDYTVRANAPMSGPGLPPETLMANVTVTGEDITGLVLTPTKSVKITGHITLDPRGTWLEPAAIRPQAMPRNPEPMMMMGIGQPTVNDDFTFELPTMPAAVFVRVFPTGPGSTPWTVKSIQYDGREVIDSGIDLSDGHDVSGVEIVLTNRQQIVSGAVSNAKGQPVLDATVIFFSQDSERWSGQTRFLGQGRPDQNGRYSVRTLPAGEYFAVAVETTNMAERGANPQAFFEDLSRTAVRVTIREGETKTLDLKLADRP